MSRLLIPGSSSSKAGQPSSFRPPRWASPQLLIEGRLPPSYGHLVGAWIETFLAHGEGDALGERVRLSPFWRYILTRKYEYDPRTWRLLHDQVIIGLPKGNSKTEGMGQDAASRFVSPFAPASPNIVLSAAAWAQTRRLMNAAKLGLTGGLLKAVFAKGLVLDDRIELPGRPGVMSRIAAHAGTNDGGLESDHYGDEIHEWVSERQERVWTVLGNSLAKRMPVVTLPSGIRVRGHQQVGITTAGSAMDSLGGRLYLKGVRVAKGEEIDPRFLFLWWEADRSWDLSTDEGLLGAILQANPAAGDFLDVENLIDRFGDIERHEFERYHLNRWVAAPDSWITFEAWLAQSAKEASGLLPPDKAKVWLGVVESKTGDSAAIMGATESHIFEVKGWDRDLRDPDRLVPREELSAEVATAMSRWSVQRLACAPPRLEREIEDWQRLYGDVIVRFDTDAPSQFAPAVGRLEQAFRAGTLSNDGSEAVARHIGNARTREVRGGVVITKEHRDSPRRIERAIAAVLAHDGATGPPGKKIDRTIRGYS